MSHLLAPSILDGSNGRRRPQLVLVATGNFNPPTYLHLRLFGGYARSFLVPPLILHF
jgi:hypothetical protein